MTTKFRIGFPYASSNPDKTREAAVIVKPLPGYQGFRQIYIGDQSYLLPDTDKGPLVLNGYHQGVIGELIEIDDHRKSIAKQIGQERKIHGEGTSSQLALILACCAIYDKDPAQLPILLFSGAIHRPAGALPFIDACIDTYCDPKEAISCLAKKFRTATVVKAKALIIPVRDAKILSEELQQPWYDLQAINQIENNEQPVIIGVGKSSLPQLAQLIGISSGHYIKDTPPKTLKRLAINYLIAFIIVLLAMFSLWNNKAEPQKKSVIKQKKPIAKKKTVDLPDSTHYAKTDPTQSKLLAIPIVRWIAGGAKAEIEGIEKSYKLAYIIDPDTANIERFLWRGTNCVLSFSLNVKDGISEVLLNDIHIVGSRQDLPKYSPKYRYLGKGKAPIAPVTTHFYYGEIVQSKEPPGKQEAEHIKMIAGEKGKYILRINAPKPGIYTFDIKLFVSSGGIKEEIILAKSVVWAFDKKE